MNTGIAILLTICSLTGTRDTILKIENHKRDSIIKVLVLPPHDRIANAGISPDIQLMLENSLSKKTRLGVIPFPFKELMGVPYQNIFDKKYCKPIIDKVDCDVIIMTQILTNNELKAGTWPWAYKVRIFRPRTGKQLHSISGDNLQFNDFEKEINSKADRLAKDIESVY